MIFPRSSWYNTSDGTGISPEVSLRVNGQVTEWLKVLGLEPSSPLNQGLVGSNPTLPAVHTLYDEQLRLPVTTVGDYQFVRR